jgi:undecaprenyl-diphosphatase
LWNELGVAGPDDPGRRKIITALQVIVLGIVQGLTEFLPISSSAHLVFFQSLFGLKEPLLLFDIMLHLGTLLAVFVFFRRDLADIVRGVIRFLRGKEETPSARLAAWIILASVPTGLMGVLLKDWFESLFAKPALAGMMLLITGIVLWLTRLKRGEGRRIEGMGWPDALLIGIAQGIAIIPGISRSGATISAGLLLGLDRELSGKFSFLLSIPAILGATLLEARKISSVETLGLNLAGLGAAFLVGLVALTFLMKIIKFGRFSSFAYYCWAAGMAMVFFSK